MERLSSSDVIVDIENLHNFLRNNPEYHCKSTDNTTARKSLTFISKVPRHSQDENKNPYDPVVVSIGPYHHGKQSLKTMENKKWRYLECFLEVNTRKSLDDYLKALLELYPLVMHHYSDEFGLKGGEFVQMLLLDACFILMALCQMECVPDSYYSLIDKQTDPWQFHLVKNDLLHIENQIPFIVVKKVYEIFMLEEKVLLSLTDKIADSIEQILYGFPVAITKSNRPKKFHHLLHLCQIYLKPSANYDYIGMQLDHGDLSLHRWYRALDYYTAGLKFEKREMDENNPHSLLDIRLTDNALEIPFFPIDEYIITIFRNLVAFEKMNPQFGNDITAYIIFMSRLISDAKDVNLLLSQGILENHFQSGEEVVDMFRELNSTVDFDFTGSYYLKNICQTLDAFYQDRMKWGKGWLRRTSTIIRDWV